MAYLHYLTAVDDSAALSSTTVLQVYILSHLSTTVLQCRTRLSYSLKTKDVFVKKLFSNMNSKFSSIFATLLILFVLYNLSRHQNNKIDREGTDLFMTLLRREQADKVGDSFLMVYPSFKSVANILVCRPFLKG